MKQLYFILILSILSFVATAQPAGYYNSTEGKTGDDLKTALHDIIKGHQEFSYSTAKEIIKYSDADPSDPDKIILIYTGRSADNDNWGISGNDLNREHVWAKSHGNFGESKPAGSDAHNLKPADASVNSSRSNKDFDDCQGGTQHSEATGCWYTSDAWEPRNEVKGDVARILFYMAVRYEGTDGEPDLQLVDQVNSSPNNEGFHGKLSTLLLWNEQDPPSAFERRRNERIFGIQHNRNPFIDHPEFADMIWGEASANPIEISNMSINPAVPYADDAVTLTVDIVNTELRLGYLLYYGTSYDSEEHSVVLSPTSGSTYTGEIPAFASEGDTVYFKIDAGNNTMRAYYVLPKEFSAAELTTITEVQGTGTSSPKNNQIVTVAGVVVANFGSSYYIQEGTGDYEGLCIYSVSPYSPMLGDSVVLTGKVSEYENLTEIYQVSYIASFESSTSYAPRVVKASDLGEPLEGQLVTIENVMFNDGGTTIPESNASYTFSSNNGSGTIFVRYDSELVGNQLPAGVVNITGIVSQYQNNYQILMRNIDDFEAGEDNEAPSVTSVTATSGTTISVNFSEKIDQATAETVSNYTFNNGIVATGASLHYTGTKVILTVSNLSTGAHQLTVNGVEDLAGNTADETVDFTSGFANIAEITQTNMTVYPNPATDRFTIALTSQQADMISISLLDMAGRMMYHDQQQLHAGLNRIPVDIKNIPQGMYILRVKTLAGISHSHLMLD